MFGNETDSPVTVNGINTKENFDDDSASDKTYNVKKDKESEVDTDLVFSDTSSKSSSESNAESKEFGTPHISDLQENEGNVKEETDKNSTSTKTVMET